MKKVSIEEMIISNLREIIPEVSYQEIKEKSFYNLGLNSIKTVDFMEKINSELPFELGVEAAFDYPDYNKLYTYIKSMLQDNNIELPGNANNQVSVSDNNKDIAIVGISGVFPGAENLEQFWDLLLERHKERINLEPAEIRAVEFQNSDTDKCSFIKDADKFEPLFFGISPLEAENMDPQHRIFLMESYKALEDAGYDFEKLRGSLTGVYVGARGSSYQYDAMKNSQSNPQLFLGCDMSLLAGRVSYFFDLKGPAITVNTACSSSLTAIHQACTSLQNNQINLAISGGVFIITEDFIGMADNIGMLTKGGGCKVFDDKASGTTLSEGCSVIILKRLQDAISDRDRIYGVIKATGINQDGRTKGITAPSSESQKQLLKNIYKKYGIEQESISYIECHGTGTKLGDPIEVNALASIFKEDENNCTTYLGSLKSNIGHPISAAGVFGVAKVLKCFEKEIIPGNSNFTTLNNHINLTGSSLKVSEDNIEWKSTEKNKRRAAISSFGFAGTNCHIVMEEFKEQEYMQDKCQFKKGFVFPVSAFTKKSLSLYIEELERFLTDNPSVGLERLSYTLAVLRNHFKHRAIFFANNYEELLGNVRDYIKNKSDTNGKDTIHSYKLNKPLNEFYNDDYKILKNSYLAGDNIEWKKLFNECKMRSVPLPSYRFDKKSYWYPVSTEANKQLVFLEPTLKSEDKEYPEFVLSFDDEENLFVTLNDLLTSGGTRNNVIKLHKIKQLNNLLNKQSKFQNIILILNDSFVDEEKLILEFLHWIKLLVAHEYTFFELKWYVVSLADTKEILIGNGMSKVLAGIYGCCQTLNLEYSRWSFNFYTTTGLDTIMDNGIKLLNGKEGVLYCKDENEWKFRTFNKTLLVQEKKNTGFKERGIYIINGGAGGLGFKVGEYLLNTYNATVILTGRREPDNLINDFISRKSKAGHKIAYIVCDSTQMENVLSLKQTVFRQYGKINGTINCALVLNDSSFENMTEVKFQQVLDSKVKTTKNLIEVFKNEELDFLLLFSSIASFLQFAGQSNYSAGCSLMDILGLNYTEEYGVNIKIINWGYWGTTGVVANSYYRNKMKQLGFSSIDPYQALKALDIFISSDKRQIICINEDETDKFEIKDFTCVKPVNSKINKRIMDDANQYFSQRFIEMIRELLNCQGEYIDLQTDIYDSMDAFLKNWIICGIYMLVENKFLVKENEKRFGLSKRAFDVVDGESLFKNGFGARVELLQLVQSNITKIAMNELLATEVLFPNGDSTFIKNVYMNNYISDYFNQIAADYVLEIVESKIKIQDEITILEIGAGTGSTTKSVLDLLAENRIQAQKIKYYFTDISKNFLVAGEKQFGNNYKGIDISYEIINIENINNHKSNYDVIIAANVLHATQNINQTLHNIQKLCIDDSYLIINELCTNSIFMHATFGLLKDWWRFNDSSARMKYSPLLQVKQWVSHLTENGFTKVKIPSEETYYLEQQIIIAKYSIKNDIETDMNYLNNNRMNQNRGLEIMSLDKVIATVVKGLKDTLKLSDIELDYDEAFADVGLDSISGISLVTYINNNLNTKLRTTDIFEYGNINDLSKYIVDTINKNNNNPPYSPKTRKEQKTQDTHCTNNIDSNEIAIIGMSGRFAQSDTLEELWEHLVNEEDLTSVQERWEKEKYNKVRGGYLKDISSFDELFFNISGIESDYMDPQQRIFLEEAWKSLEDSGYSGNEDVKNKCGVFVGYNGTDYKKIQGNDRPAQAFWGNAGSIVSSRIAYFLNLKGPAITVDTACSSSLVAIHLACQSLKSRETNLAIAGGTFVQSTPQYVEDAQKAGMLSEDGKCYTFDARANGFVWGEGAGAIVLKRLDDAVNDNDLIYGVIRASGLNQDGRTNGITAPNRGSQEELLKEVYTKSGINPEDISMFEAHGTGTNLGDPVEFEAATKAYTNFTDKKCFCPIGSVKTNIGHASAAAGIAGVIKILLSIRHKKIPASLNYITNNENIDFENSPFYHNTVTQDWDEPICGRRNAAISAFGFSGTNAHMIISEFECSEEAIEEQTVPRLIVISAKSRMLLKEYANELIQFIKNNKVSLGNLSYTLMNGRVHFSSRIAVVVNNMDELTNILEEWIQSDTEVELMSSPEVSPYVKMKRSIESFGKQCIVELLGENNYYKYRELLMTIAELYVNGVSLQYKDIFRKEKLHIIHLPLYKFRKRRHWINNQKEYADIKIENISTFDAIKFKIGFTGQHYFLEQHKINGKKTLPAVVYQEIINQAFSRLMDCSYNQIIIENIEWNKSAVAEGKNYDIILSFERVDESYFFSFSEINNTTSRNVQSVLCKGIVKVGSNCERQCVELERYKELCNEKKYVSEQCYDIFKNTCVSYGSGFKNIENVMIGNEYAISKITGTNTVYQLEPGLLDSCLQTVVCYISTKYNDYSYIPYTTKRIETYGDTENVMWVLCKCNQLTDDFGNFNILVINEKNEVIITYENIIFKKINQKTVNTQCFVKYREQLNHVTHNQTVALYKNMKKILIFFNMPDIQDDLSEIDETIKINLQGSNKYSDRYITNAIVKVIETLKTIVLKYKDNKFVQIIMSDKEESLPSAVCSIVKSMELECSSFKGQVIQTDSGHKNKVIRDASQYSNLLVIDKNKNYYTERYQLIKTNAAEKSKLWKNGGVYVITGGYGKLAQVLLERILEEVKGCTIILLGRLGEQKKKVVKNNTIEYLQVDVSEYNEVEDAVAYITKNYNGINGILHCAGVIKDSLVWNKGTEDVRDVLAPKVSGVVNLDWATAHCELDFFVNYSAAAVVYGNIGQTDYVAANAFLDSFSIYRNKLVEAKQRRGRTISINWPLWESGGMQLSKENRELLHNRTGLLEMPIYEGMNALYTAWNSGESVVLITYGVKEDIEKKLDFSKVCGEQIIEHRAEEIKQTQPVDSNNHVSVIKDNIKEKERPVISNTEKLKANTIQLVSQVLQVDKDEIEEHVNLGEYGFDSITYTELANLINKEYKQNIMPTFFYEENTIAKVVEYLNERVADDVVIKKNNYITSEDTKEIIVENLYSSETEEVKVKSEYKNDEGKIAVIGMSGFFPEAHNVEEFWNNLRENKCSISVIPNERWNWEDYADEITSDGKPISKWGGFIDETTQFDPQFFGITPKEAVCMDPQQRLLMMTAWNALEDAGYSERKIKHSNTGIYVGTGNNGYMAERFLNGFCKEVTSATGNVPSMGPNRMSYFLDIHGPSEAIETACSSSLVAINRAVDALKGGKCDMALAGGVNTIVSPQLHLSYGKAGMMSEDGLCKAFSSDANGYVRGEGAGILVLKRLAEAKKDRDYIYGVILGGAENHGGRANSLTSPNPSAQADVITAAIKNAGINASTISYIEAHGTGTELGDPIEMEGLKIAFSQSSKGMEDKLNKMHCGIGSVKTNIGHLELAAGVAGVIKVLLQMKEKKLVKSLHCNKLNPYINIEDSQFYIVRENSEWKHIVDEEGNTIPLRAGVSSFGFGGVNAHIIMEEYIQEKAESKMGDEDEHLILLSAKSKKALFNRAENLIHDVEHYEGDLGNIAYTLQVGRSDMPYRMGFITKNKWDLINILKDYTSGYNPKAVLESYIKHISQVSASISCDTNEWDSEQLLRAFINGESVDWEKTYIFKRPKVSLTGYPFELKKYWYEPAKNTSFAETEKTEKRENIPLSDGFVTLEQLDTYMDEKKECVIDYQEEEVLANEEYEIQDIDRILHGIVQGTLDVEKAEQMLSSKKEENMPNKNRAEIVEFLLSSLSGILSMNIEEIELDDKFKDLGLDSITGIEWIEKINKTFSLNIKTTQLYNYPTIEDFMIYLEKRLTGGKGK